MEVNPRTWMPQNSDEMLEVLAGTTLRHLIFGLTPAKSLLHTVAETRNEWPDAGEK